MKSIKRYKFADDFNDGSCFGNLSVQGHDCEYGIFDICFAPKPSVKDCLCCHRSLMNKSRKDYLDFYKNVFLPWNNESEKGGSANGGESKKDAKS